MKMDSISRYGEYAAMRKTPDLMNRKKEIEWERGLDEKAWNRLDDIGTISQLVIMLLRMHFNPCTTKRMIIERFIFYSDGLRSFHGKISQGCSTESSIHSIFPCALDIDADVHLSTSSCQMISVTSKARRAIIQELHPSSSGIRPDREMGARPVPEGIPRSRNFGIVPQIHGRSKNAGMPVHCECREGEKFGNFSHTH
jgi:hypothetical protein